MTLQKEHLSVLTEEGAIHKKGEVMVGERLLPHASFHFLFLSPWTQSGQHLSPSYPPVSSGREVSYVIVCLPGYWSDIFQTQ